MNKKKIETDYKNKIKLLIKYNKFYFDKDSPIVTDNIYDDLKTSILLKAREFYIHGYTHTLINQAIK